jgi:rare lipoprotein A
VIPKLFLFLFFVALAFKSFSQSDSLLIQTGTASYYGKKFQGRKTSNGERFHVDSLTAAHKILPFGTRLRVTNLKNGLSVTVRINDRLPSYSTRHIDLSLESARRLDMLRDGLAKVRIEAVDLGELEKLFVYFSTRDSKGLRLRPYSIPLNVPRRMLDLELVKIGKSELRNPPIPISSIIYGSEVLKKRKKKK